MKIFQRKKEIGLLLFFLTIGMIIGRHWFRSPLTTPTIKGPTNPIKVPGPQIKEKRFQVYEYFFEKNSGYKQDSSFDSSFIKLLPPEEVPSLGKPSPPMKETVKNESPKEVPSLEKVSPSTKETVKNEPPHGLKKEPSLKEETSEAVSHSIHSILEKKFSSLEGNKLSTPVNHEKIMIPLKGLTLKEAFTSKNLLCHHTPWLRKARIYSYRKGYVLVLKGTKEELASYKINLKKRGLTYSIFP